MFLNKKLPIEIAECVRSMFAALEQWDGGPACGVHAAPGGDASVFVRAFVDGYLGLPYDDGIGEPHDLTVCVPLNGPSARRSYRLGYLAGQAARIPLN